MAGGKNGFDAHAAVKLHPRIIDVELVHGVEYRGILNDTGDLREAVDIVTVGVLVALVNHGVSTGVFDHGVQLGAGAVLIAVAVSQEDIVNVSGVEAHGLYVPPVLVPTGGPARVQEDEGTVVGLGQIDGHLVVAHVVQPVRDDGKGLRGGEPCGRRGLGHSFAVVLGHKAVDGHVVSGIQVLLVNGGLGGDVVQFHHLGLFSVAVVLVKDHHNLLTVGGLVEFAVGFLSDGYVAEPPSREGAGVGVELVDLHVRGQGAGLVKEIQVAHGDLIARLGGEPAGGQHGAGFAVHRGELGAVLHGIEIDGAQVGHVRRVDIFDVDQLTLFVVAQFNGGAGSHRIVRHRNERHVGLGHAGGGDPLVLGALAVGVGYVQRNGIVGVGHRIRDRKSKASTGKLGAHWPVLHLRPAGGLDPSGFYGQRAGQNRKAYACGQRRGSGSHLNAVLHTEIPPFFLWMAFGREAKALETPAAYLDLTTKLFGTQIRFFNHFNRKSG